MRFVSALFFLIACAAAAAASDTKGVIGGRVTDPQGSVVTQAQVEITNLIDGHKQTATTDDLGRFEFRYVDVGEYQVLVSVLGFAEVAARVTVTSSQHVEINLELSKVRPISEEINITPASEVLDTRGSSVQTGFSMVDVQHLAGGSESIAGLEAHTGTAWRSQEHLHIRGAHQVGYQVNGINIPDLSIFGAITPFIDMRNIKFTEVTTGGLAAEFGNRTAGVVNTLVRSGFDHGYGNGQIELSGGNLSRGSIFAGYGNHRGEKFAYYFQGTALTSGRGFNPTPDAISALDGNRNGQADVLDAPSSQTRHNGRRTFQGFSNLEWRPTGRDSFNLVLGGFRSNFQVPNTIDQESLGRDYVQFERDHFENLQWARTVSSAKLLTAGFYHHFSQLETDGRVDDPALPLASDDRRANYWGAKVDLGDKRSQHFIKMGGEIYSVSLGDDFGVLPNPASNSAAAPFGSRVLSRAIEGSLYVQDQFDVSSLFTLSYGTRLDLFHVRYDLKTQPDLKSDYAFLSPRLGLAYRLGKSNAVLFANLAYVFLPPPIEFFELPAASSSPGSVFPPGISFTPVKPEKDIQYDAGIRFSVHGFRARVNQWFKRQNRFLDHVQLASLGAGGDSGQLINPNIFLPVNLDRARTYGLESFIDSPAYRGLRVFMNYSLNYAQAIGGVVNGFNDGGQPESKYFFLDHDQRHQIYVGADYQMEGLHAFANATFSFGSGFPDASDSLFGRCVTRDCRLPAHSTLNLAIGKTLANHVRARLEIENMTDSVYPINLGSEFNGSHVSAPRLVTLRLSYQF